MITAIINALIADGDGGPPVRGAVLLRNDRIAAVMRDPLPANFATGAEVTVDATGQVLAPGFIDAHGHSDLALLAAPEAIGKLAQGITTEIAGNCGLSPFPLSAHNRDHLQELYAGYGERLTWTTYGEYAQTVAQRQPGINLGLLCGHNSLRAAVRGYAPGEASPTELATMCQMLRASLDQGALGLSTGLLYVPGKFASHEELTTLLEELAKFATAAPAGTRALPLPYATHLRSEGSRLIEALDEAVSVCRASGQLRLHISHLKTAGASNWDKLDAVLQCLTQARHQGLAVTADRYPYTASLTQLSAMLPSPWDDLGDAELSSRLAEPTVAIALTQALAEKPSETWQRWRLVAAGPAFGPAPAGATIAELATARGIAPAAVCVAALGAGASQALVASEGMCEANLRRILAEPWVCGGTDERALPPDGRLGHGHPRGYGAIVKHLQWLLPDFGIGEAVRRLTSLPAGIFNLRHRGRIAPGHFADLVLFAPERLDAPADFAHPFRLAAGISRVWVNGVLSWQDGAATGRRGGCLYHRSGSEPVVRR